MVLMFRLLAFLSCFVAATVSAAAVDEHENEEHNLSSGACDTSAGSYDLNLHIMAVFLLLVSSAFGVFAPLILGQQAGKRKWIAEMFFGLKHAGNGVLISTAFIHLLFEGFSMFSDECLSRELEFEPAAPAITMAGVIIVFTVDFSTVRSMLRGQQAVPPTTINKFKASDHCMAAQHDKEVQSQQPQDQQPLDSARKLSMEEQRKHWEVNMLEGGTVFHSFIVGLTIGAQSGPGFHATLAAIVFHQMFEGAGLGARIATLRYLPGQRWKKWTMAVVFAFTTSAGMTLGILIRKSVNLQGNASLLVIGTLESLSAGILLYASIATLLVGDWLHGDMLHASNGRVTCAALLFALGMGVMAFIGKYV